MKTIAILIAAAALTGCASWSHPTKTEGEFNQDRFSCEQRASSMYPVQIQSMGPGYQTPARTNCTSFGNQVNCTTMPGTHTPGPQQDVNALNRAFGFKSCMQSMGWSQK